MLWLPTGMQHWGFGRLLWCFCCYGCVASSCGASFTAWREGDGAIVVVIVIVVVVVVVLYATVCTVASAIPIAVVVVVAVVVVAVVVAVIQA